MCKIFWQPIKSSVGRWLNTMFFLFTSKWSLFFKRPGKERNWNFNQKTKPHQKMQTSLAFLLCLLLEWTESTFDFPPYFFPLFFCRRVNQNKQISKVWLFWSKISVAFRPGHLKNKHRFDGNRKNIVFSHRPTLL